MQAVFQHPQDLSLAIFNGEPTHPMTLLKSTRVSLGTWDAYFHIIGESHALILCHAGQPIFSESLSCVPVHKASHIHRFTTLKDYQYQQEDYGVWVTFNPPTWALPSLANEMTLTFPPIFGQTPLTRIQWQDDNNCLQWWTLHLYPLDSKIIHVHTMSYYQRGT